MRPWPWLVLLVGCAEPSVQVDPVQLSNSVLSWVLLVTAESDEATATAVCVAEDDAADRHVIPSPGVGAELDLWLAGVRGGVTYACTVEVAQGNRTTAVDVDVDVPELPTNFPVFETEGSAPNRDWLVLNRWNQNLDSPMLMVVLDDQARARWYRELQPTKVAVDTAQAADGRLFAGGGPDIDPTWFDALGRQSYQTPINPTAGGYHHHAEPLADGTVLTLTLPDNVDPDSPDSDPWEGFNIVWMQPDGTPIWIWESQDAVDKGQLEVPVGGIRDPYHANSVSLVDDALGPAAWVSLHFDQSLVRIDRDTGDITHRLGSGGDFTLVDAEGKPITGATWFSGTHDPEWEWPLVTLYDNGWSGRESRIVQYRLDLEAGTAEEVWSWTDGWFEPLFGDVDRTSDGRWMITRGACQAGCPGFNLPPGRFSEMVTVDPTTGEADWTVRASKETDGIYRAERIDPCRLFHLDGLCDGADIGPPAAQGGAP